MFDLYKMRLCGGQIEHDDKPQVVMERNTDRVSAFVYNGSSASLSVFAGEVVSLPPDRAVLLTGYKGPVKLTGLYTQRFSAAEWTKDTDA